MRIAGFVLGSLGLLYVALIGLGYYITVGTKWHDAKSVWTPVVVAVTLISAGCLLIRFGRRPSP